MSSICKHLTLGVIALALVAWSAVAVNAQYVTYYQPYSSYYQPYTSYYQPTTSYYAPATSAYTSYYAPSAYQTYYAPTAAAYQTYYAPAATTPVVYTSGWYPGYWLGRTRDAIFGRPAVVSVPTTYAASYPTTYAASYPTTYTASYPTTYTASYPTNYVASYAAAPACSSCATPQQVTMRPVCATGCSTCEQPCTSCGVATVTPASYVEQSPACTNCGTGVTTSSTLSPTPANGPSTYQTTQPGLSPSEPVPSTRTNRPESTSPPATGGESSGSQNGTGATNTSNGAADPLDRFFKDEQESANFFRAPELFDPQDKTVKFSPAPVHMAVYRRPAGETPDHSVTARPISISAEKAQRDAAGWKSAAR